MHIARKRNPDLTSGEVKERAAKKYQSVSELSTRQFHARYALQAKKKLAGPRKRSAQGRRATRAKASASNHGDPVRELLRQQFEERRGLLDEAMDEPFRRSIEADSLEQVNELLATMDQQTRELQKK